VPDDVVVVGKHQVGQPILPINCQTFQAAVLEGEDRIFAETAAMRGVADHDVIQPAEI